MEKRQVGNRRSEEELELIKISVNKTAFALAEQPNFDGTDEQLEMMQNIERAYIDSDIKVSDEEWEILKLRHKYVESTMSISPSGRPWIKLFSPLPSIDKCCSMDELKIFLSKFRPSQEFRIETKLDGLPGNFRYEYNKQFDSYILDSVASKGNGRYGLGLNPFALSGVRMNVPQTIEPKYVTQILNLKTNDVTDVGTLPEYFELRGEAVIRQNAFAINKYGKNPVWRSVAAGIFNRKVPANFDGLFIYLYGQSFSVFIGDQDSITVDNIFEARLFASLDEKAGAFLRGDKLTIFKDRKINVLHKNGETYSFYDKGEELDVVFYSVSIEDSNIDTEKIRDIKGIKYIDNVKFQEDCGNLDENEIKLLKDAKLTYRITADRDEIIQAVADFYGTDVNGNRDLKRLRLRNLYEYAIDGVVIKPVGSNRETQGMYFRNHKNNPNKIVVPKYPEDQIAIKLLSEIVNVKLLRIEYSTTTLGNTTCSGVLDRAYQTESGAMVERINLHNIEWLPLNSWIKEGNSYEMIMSMDIIPVLLDPALHSKEMQNVNDNALYEIYKETTKII